jgi:hypothetical protein
MKAKPFVGDEAARRVELRDREAVLLVELAGLRPGLRPNEVVWLRLVAENAAALSALDPASPTTCEQHFRITQLLIERMPSIRRLLGDVSDTRFAEIVSEAVQYWEEALLGAEPAGRG